MVFKFSIDFFKKQDIIILDNKICFYIRQIDNSKLTERLGRKATGLRIFYDSRVAEIVSSIDLMSSVWASQTELFCLGSKMANNTTKIREDGRLWSEIAYETHWYP